MQNFKTDHSQKQNLQKIYQRYVKFTNIDLIKIFQTDYVFKKLDHCLIIYNILRNRNIQIPKDIEIKVKHLNKVKQKLEDCSEYFNKAKDGWKVQKFGKNSVTSKIVNKSEIIMILQGQFEIQFFKLAMMVYDVAKFNQWFPFCKQSKDILNIGLAQKYVFLKAQVPFLSARQGYFLGQALNRIQTSNIMSVFCQSITGNKQIANQHNINLQINQKSVQLQLKLFTAELQMKKPKVFDFRMYIHVDINVQLIPQFVLGYVSKKFGQILFGKMIDRANSIDLTQHQKNLKEKTMNFSHWLETVNKEWIGRYNQKHQGKKIQLVQPHRLINHQNQMIQSNNNPNYLQQPYNKQLLQPLQNQQVYHQQSIQPPQYNQYHQIQQQPVQNQQKIIMSHQIPQQQNIQYVPLGNNIMRSQK